MDAEKLAQELFECLKVLRKGPIEEAQALSQGEKCILTHLAFQQDNVTPTELSRLFHVSTARVANALNSLEKKGCIERLRSNEDRRKVYVHIMEAGRETARYGRDRAIASLSELLSELGEEDAEAYVRIMKKFVRIVREKEARLLAEEADGSGNGSD